MVDLNIKLPDTFLQEEDRDGYLVSAKMKELWAVQLDLLCEFDRVCKKYGIKYVLDFGTLLGAIRHKGYIPWDDDLDVSMLREDYDKLMEIGPKEFKQPYFLQSYLTEKNYDRPVSKLVRIDTAYLPGKDLRREPDYVRGIFIDIFVFDNMPTPDDETIKAMVHYTDDVYYRILLMTHFPTKDDGIKMPAKLFRYWCYRLRYGSAREEYRRLDQKAKSYPLTGYVGTVTYVYPHFRPLSVYNEIIEVPFEHLMMPVPAGYDEVLRLRYGDYMTPVQGGSWHTMAVFDTDRPYNEVVKKYW